MKLQGTVINKKDITRFEVTAVYSHPEATVDIVLVHGLNGQPQKTWTAKNGVYWPTDLLPYTLEKAGARANIIVYGYNADVVGENPSTEFVHDKAQTLVTFLTAFRKTSGTLTNPILWVAHSLGGIVTKQALIYSDGLHDADKEDERSVYISTYGIIFLGTPHSGSELAAWGEMLQRMVGFVPRRIFDSEPVLIKTLRSNSETLRGINLAFTNMVGRFKIHLVHEAHKTDLKGTKAFVVDSQSAAPEWATAKSYGIEADHSGMCKFESNTAPGYRPVSSALVEWALVADRPDQIPSRWIVEKQSRMLRNTIEKHVQDGSLTEACPVLFPGPDLPLTSCHQVIDAHSGATQLVVPRPDSSVSAEHVFELPPSPMLPLLQTSQTSLAQRREPLTGQSSIVSQHALFIRPEAFRPNSYSVGRETEIEELHAILQDPKRRIGGTSTALIHGATGVGKSHLAREYVYAHQKDYPGGVFWFRACSEQELEDEFWRFATTTILADLNRGQGDITEFQDHTKMVEHVRNWFGQRQDWLFVLDGIMFNPVLKRFVPDTENTAMILTSTSRAFTGNFRFNNPKALELKALPALEACELLRQELEKKDFTADEDASALDLVRLLDNLPLHIHIIAQNLKMTQEPLPTFVKRFRARPRLSQQIPAYDFVLDQLADMGAYAAVNVLSVLSFFERNIPVEMLALGLPALPRNLPYKTRDAGLHDRASFNQTIKVLIAFALVDRLSSYELSPSSSRTSKKSLDFSNQTMDTLRTHTMLQRYMIDSKMEREKTHIDWLEHAVDVFFLAFEEADKRIKYTPKIGLPDDYRRFALHGRKLLEHLTHYEKKNSQLVPLRKQMEDRLEYIKGAAAYLSDTIHALVVNQSGSSQQTSVFDRANSLSESDSGTGSNHSQESWVYAGEYPDQMVMSPVAVAGDGERLYGQHDDGSTSMPSPYDNDEATPTLHGTPKPSTYQHSGFPLPFEDGSGPTKLPSKPSTYSHDYLVGRNNENHKSQPDVSVSHETVEAPRYSFNTGHRGISGSAAQTRVSAQSHAELALTQIRKASPTPPRGGGRIQNKGRTYSGASQTRPLDMLKNTGYTKGYATSGLTPTEEPTLAELSKDFNIPPPGTSYSSTFQRFKENMNYFKRRRSSASSNPKPGLEVPSSAHTSPGVEQMARMSPFPALPTRSARSSPGQGFAPFYPPETAEGRPPSSVLRRSGNLAPKFQQWNTSEVAYHPPLDRIDSSNLGQNPMTMSLPSPERYTHRQGTGGVFTPAAWLQGQEDAVAQPMSRGSSYPSSNSNPPHSSRKRSNDSTRLGVPGTADARRTSSPHAAPISPLVTAPLQPPLVPPRASSSSSRPTSIMTEPSPRISPRYEAVDPPYQTPLGAARHMGRPRAGSQSSGYSLGSYVPSGASAASASAAVTMPEPTIPPTPSRRDGRRKPSWGWGNKIRSSQRGRGRAHSASPSAGLRGGSSSSNLRYRQEQGGEDMSRSASGGSGGLLVRDASGTPHVVGFGEVPPVGTLANADERGSWSVGRGPGHRQQPSVQSPPMSRSSSGGVGLGITPEGEATD